jgi:hypothetical protein
MAEKVCEEALFGISGGSPVVEFEIHASSIDNTMTCCHLLQD